MSLAQAVASGASAAQVRTLLDATVLLFEAPPGPGVMTVQLPTGPAVPVSTSASQLARARGAVAWASTTGADLLALLPDGHDLLVDPAGARPLLLPAVLWGQPPAP